MWMKDDWTIGFETESNIHFKATTTPVSPEAYKGDVHLQNPEQLAKDGVIFSLLRKTDGNEMRQFMRAYGDDANENDLTLEIVVEPLFVRETELHGKWMEKMDALKKAIYKSFQDWDAQKTADNWELSGDFFNDTLKDTEKFRCIARSIYPNTNIVDVHYHGTQVTFGVPYNDAEYLISCTVGLQENEDHWYKKKDAGHKDCTPLFWLLANEMDFCIVAGKWNGNEFDTNDMETADFKNKWDIALRTPPKALLDDNPALLKELSDYVSKKADKRYDELLRRFRDGSFHIGHPETIREIGGAEKQLVFEWRKPTANGLTKIMDELKSR
ncbi:MAG: hypothetical protein IJ682_06875 [Lachnospiraceae bacterium]|nr:hypothetical protein [Lachnospiraceae bacterium]